MSRDSELTRPLAKAGAAILLKYLEGKMAGNEQVKIALSSLQTHVKMMATEANDDTNKLGLAKMIYNDPKLREKYIRDTMPYMIAEPKKE